MADSYGYMDIDMDMCRVTSSDCSCQRSSKFRPFQMCCSLLRSREWRTTGLMMLRLAHAVAVAFAVVAAAATAAAVGGA